MAKHLALLLATLLLPSLATAAPVSPTVTEAAVLGGDLVILGREFGGAQSLPAVQLGGIDLHVASATDDTIRALLALNPGLVRE